MAASFEDVEQWKEEGKKRGAKYIISVCDTFSYDDYPVYIMPNEDLNEKRKKFSRDMQKINEVIIIDYDSFIVDQIDEKKKNIFKLEKTEMNAKTAREMTKKNIMKDSNSIKKEIDDKIQVAISKKEFSIEINVPPASEKEILKKHYVDTLGFKWQHNSGGDQRDPYPASVTISW